MKARLVLKPRPQAGNRQGTALTLATQSLTALARRPTLGLAGLILCARSKKIVREGDRVTADALLLDATNLSVDQSLLTGESVPVMTRPPRDRNEPLFSRRHVFYSVLQGLVVLAVVLAIFAAARVRGLSEAEARAQSYTTLCRNLPRTKYRTNPLKVTIETLLFLLALPRCGWPAPTWACAPSLCAWFGRGTSSWVRLSYLKWQTQVSIQKPTGRG